MRVGPLLTSGATRVVIRWRVDMLVVRYDGGVDTRINYADTGVGSRDEADWGGDQR
jgi:hypothetical protein